VLVTGRSARTGRVSRWWRVPAGTHLWVVLAVMTPRPRTARVGDADTTPSYTDGPVGSQNEASHGRREQFVPQRAVRSGDRGARQENGRYADFSVNPPQSLPEMRQVKGIVF
jgi:hypothetical protein